MNANDEASVSLPLLIGALVAVLLGITGLTVLGSEPARSDIGEIIEGLDLLLMPPDPAAHPQATRVPTRGIWVDVQPSQPGITRGMNDDRRALAAGPALSRYALAAGMNDAADRVFPPAGAAHGGAQALEGLPVPLANGWSFPDPHSPAPVSGHLGTPAHRWLGGSRAG